MPELSMLLLVIIIIMAIIEIETRHMAAIESMLSVVNTILVEADPGDIEKISQVLKTSSLDSLPLDLFKHIEFLRSIKINLTAKQRKKVTNEFAKLACDYLGISPEAFEDFMKGTGDRFPKGMDRSIAVRAEMYVAAFNQVLLSLSHDVSWLDTLAYLAKVRQVCRHLEERYSEN